MKKIKTNIKILKMDVIFFKIYKIFSEYFFLLIIDLYKLYIYLINYD